MNNKFLKSFYFQYSSKKLNFLNFFLKNFKSPKKRPAISKKVLLGVCGNPTYIFKILHFFRYSTETLKMYVVFGFKGNKYDL